MNSSTTDWKDKYLTALEQEEKRERQHRQVTELLIRAVVRISLVADGVDSQLDKQLAGLRSMLRDGSPSARDLNTVVNALEGQVKRLGTVKTERAKVLSNAFQSLVRQLKNLKPVGETKKQLGQFDKKLKQRGGSIQEYAPLINEFSELQSDVLEGVTQTTDSKPFWHVWSKASTEDVSTDIQDKEPSAEPETSAENVDTAERQKDSPKQDQESELNQLNSTPLVSPDATTNLPPVADEGKEQLAEEPSYSKLNQHIREVLTELLDQIEPPPLAKDNYKAARKQIAAGLPWYELVPTLEDISLVVVSSFDLNQRDFEQYLGQLNSRLSDAYAFIDQSQQLNEQTSKNSEAFNGTVRDHMSEMRDSVESATELDQLKAAVSSKLDQLVSVMDNHQIDEIERDATLSDQLNVLVERVRLMESDSKLAEQRIEEQRQKALRDVLTQLPNREAYGQRLEQEFDRWRRYERPLSVVVGDIDHFKGINDEYGHLAGDKVLRIIAKSLAKRLRKTDFIARYGGEEFVILMPETNQEQAFKVIEGVREAVASCPFHFKDKPVSLTMSFGITAFIKDDEPDLAFERADKALYEAKDGGRNCSVLAPIEVADSEA